MQKLTPEFIAAARDEVGVPHERFPKHIAIIMDGNGRWATQRGLPRPAGHIEGAKIVRRIIKESARLGLEALSLYSFSIENWTRPEDEVNTLMGLYADYLISERQTCLDYNIKLHHVGFREKLPDLVLDEIDESYRVTADHTGMKLCLVLNYGGRAEIARAAKIIAKKAAAGEIDPEDVDEKMLESNLTTVGVPDPDLIVRTSGEMRLSNFLLWQSSYAEFYVTDTLWPDFDENCLHDSIRNFAGRNRRFGGVDSK